MTVKFSTFFLTLLLAFVLYQSEATVPNGSDNVDHSMKATNSANPIAHSNVRGKAYAIDIDRHLEGEKNIHKKSKIPFFHVLLATLIVNVVTLVSLLSLIPILLKSKWSCFKSLFWVANIKLHAKEVVKSYASIGKGIPVKNIDKQAKEQQTAAHFCDILIPSLTCGVILATTLFLIIPEAILFIQRGTSSVKGEIELLTGTIARFGVAVMVGFMLPLVLGAFFPIHDECVSSSDLPTMKIHKKDPPHKIIVEEEKCDEEDKDVSLPSKETFDIDGNTNGNEIKVGASFESKSTNIISDSSTEEDSDAKSNEQENDNINFRLATSIFLGDAAHNIIDGFFIGIAFMTCSNAIAILVTMITIYKETSQEMINYFILTKCAGVSIPRSLLLNFASGLFVIVGALVIMVIGPGELAIGVFLSFAAGVYLHVSASECLPRVYSVVICSKDRFFSILFFALGALPIGLTLLKHGHCDA